MNKLFKTLFLFGLPILIVGILTEFLLRSIPNDYSYKNQYITNHAKNIKVLFLGSSHTLYGINPAFISENSFNAANRGQSLNFDFEIFKKFNPNFDSLKYLFIAVDYFSLYYRIDTGSGSWRVKNYNIYYDIKTGSNSIYNYSELMTYGIKDNLSRLYKYYVKGKSDLNCNQYGWGFDHNSKNQQDLELTSKEAIKRHALGGKWCYKECFEENLQTLKTFINIAQKRNIKVVLFTCPAYKSYVDHMEPMQLANLLNATHLLVNSYPNVFYLNYLDDSDFVKNDFYDANHLNEIGTKIFSLKIDKFLNSHP